MHLNCQSHSVSSFQSPDTFNPQSVHSLTAFLLFNFARGKWFLFFILNYVHSMLAVRCSALYNNKIIALLSSASNAIDKIIIIYKTIRILWRIAPHLSWSRTQKTFWILDQKTDLVFKIGQIPLKIVNVQACELGTQQMNRTKQTRTILCSHPHISWSVGCMYVFMYGCIHLLIEIR